MSSLPTCSLFHDFCSHCLSTLENAKPACGHKMIMAHFTRFFRVSPNPGHKKSEHLTAFTTKRPQTPQDMFASVYCCSYYRVVCNNFEVVNAVKGVRTLFVQGSIGETRKVRLIHHELDSYFRKQVEWKHRE
ncbi:hypothetical protein BDR04DRAFT_617150 [Suillus decipiens]|nr:hypothetical protein BDR04DRAFT_617150 [Suillus decipiens]